MTALVNQMIVSHIKSSLKPNDKFFTALQFRSLLEELTATELKQVISQLENKLDTIHFSQSQIIIDREQLIALYDSIFLNDSERYFTFNICLHGASIDVREVRIASKKKFQLKQEKTAESVRRFYRYEMIEEIESISFFNRLKYLFNPNSLSKKLKNK
ncbi:MULTISPECIES: hypothetical protein [Flavobacterium]|uniref:Uncharacterized protein n=1 Tax=Flavobacterium keumense TaxID=1306518 RepID=A0ABY8N7K8_9FLAO|nr:MULTISPECIES: hypothetical protein [Flavobacterium]WGK94257.1 hypothetical protein MG292_09240 [Flavobacterium keumense]